MSIYKQFSTSSEKETNGIEVKLNEVENADGTTPVFLVSRMGKSNKAYAKALEQATKPYRRQIELGSMSNEKAEEIALNVFCDTVIKGWSHVLDDAGVEIPFNKQNAIKLFTDLPELYERLQDEARLIVNFRNDALEAEAKN